MNYSDSYFRQIKKTPNFRTPQKNCPQRRQQSPQFMTKPKPWMAPPKQNCFLLHWIAIFKCALYASAMGEACHLSVYYMYIYLPLHWTGQALFIDTSEVLQVGKLAMLCYLTLQRCVSFQSQLGFAKSLAVADFVHLHTGFFYLSKCAISASIL